MGVSLIISISYVISEMTVLVAWITHVFSMSSAFINVSGVQTKIQHLFHVILDEWERAETVGSEALLSDILCKVLLSL